MNGIFYGVGVGPGDPELITLKTARLIEQADIVAFLVNGRGESQAKSIAAAHLRSGQTELPIYMPMSEDPAVGDKVYDEASTKIEASLVAGSNVVFLCEGDPLFFGSFAYLLARLQTRFQCESVPGISSPHAASSALNLPLTMMKESFTVISGRHNDVFVEQALLNFDSVIIMKAGRSRPKLIELLSKTCRTNDANYLEYIGRENERIVSDITTLSADELGPYFSLFLVAKSPGDLNGRRA